MKFLKICIITLVLHMHIALNAFNSQDIDEKGFSIQATAELAKTAKQFSLAPSIKGEQTIKHLLQANANPNIKVNKPPNQTTLLHRLSFMSDDNQIPLLQILLDSKADVNILTADWIRPTPLHELLRFDKFKPQITPTVITMLLDAGADPTLKNRDGDTPLQVVKKRFYAPDRGSSKHNEFNEEFEQYWSLVAQLLLRYGSSLSELSLLQVEINPIFLTERKTYLEKIKACIPVALSEKNMGPTPAHIIISYIAEDIELVEGLSFSDSTTFD